MSSLKERVSSTVEFIHYQDGNLIYRCTYDLFEFPVPIADCGSARFLNVDRGMIFMKWIKRQMKLLEDTKGTKDESDESVKGC